MSEFHINVVRLGEIEKHPNADTLSVTKVFGYPVIVRTGEFSPGDLAVYVPVDSVVPPTEPFAFLGDHRRIKAKKLRGTFSMGLLTKAPDGAVEGDDVRETLGIEKYEPPEPLTMGGENEKDPGFIPIYTDIEGYRRWPNVLRAGEGVAITEKIHGANARFVFHEGRLWVGSRTCIKKEIDSNMWWQIAKRHDLARLLALYPGLVFYGEVYGAVQDLKYGTKNGETRLRMFDVFDISEGRYLDAGMFDALIKESGFERAPVLHEGPWDTRLLELAEGKSTIADHVREGFVVRPVKERFCAEMGGRCILKMIGEGYLLRKE